MFDNETPQDIMDWKIEDVGALVKDPEWYNGPSVRVRLNLIKSIAKLKKLYYYIHIVNPKKSKKEA